MDSTCEFIYDVAYEDSISKATSGITTSNKSLIIFKGTSPIVYTQRADFILNSTHLIISNSLSIFWNTVHVPLELADISSSSLPSNAYGNWQINNHSAPFSTAEQNNFNALIQSISGIAFEVGRVSGDQYVLDNLKLKTCCP